MTEYTWCEGSDEVERSMSVDDITAMFEAAVAGPWSHTPPSNAHGGEWTDPYWTHKPSGIMIRITDYGPTGYEWEPFPGEYIFCRSPEEAVVETVKRARSLNASTAALLSVVSAGTVERIDAGGEP